MLSSEEGHNGNIDTLHDEADLRPFITVVLLFDVDVPFSNIEWILHSSIGNSNFSFVLLQTAPAVAPTLSVQMGTETGMWNVTVLTVTKLMMA